MVKVRNIRTGATKILHTDRIRVIHEDNVTPQMNPNVRRAYPVHEPCETRKTKVDLQSLDPFPFLSQDNDDITEADENSSIRGSKNESNDENEVSDKEQDESQGNVAASSQPTYDLRSKVNVQDLPRVMQTPLEYRRNK